MHEKKIITKNPVEEFRSKFEYAWNFEKGNPRVSAEHYFVNWSIENLHLLLLEEHKSVSSPTFVLDSSKTEWHIEVYPNGLCNETQSIDLFLYRSDDNGPGNVGLTFRFGVLTDNGILWLKEKKIGSFKKNIFSTISIDGAERAFLSRRMFLYSQLFELKCEMYVTFPDSHYDESLLQPSDYDLINFAFDISKLTMATEIADFRVNVPGWSINTHKAILAARSVTFKEFLQDKNSGDEIDLRDIAFDNLPRVLHFMYSGSISMALKGEPPSIGFYECAEKFAVVDLMALFIPKHLHLRSVLKSQELNFTWNVMNFIKRTTFRTTCIKSPPFGPPCDKAPKWYLTVELNRASDLLSVFVETSGETEALHSVLKISLLDGNGKAFNTHATTQFKKPQEKFGFPEFLKEFEDHCLVYDLLLNDSLQVHCELFFVVSDDVCEAHDITIAGPSNFLDHYRNLSSNLSKLFETSGFSDIVVKTRDNTTFKVHRPILFARSRKFYSKFLYYNKGERTLEVSDVDSDLVRMMFEHAYSGILKPLPASDMLRLHKAADSYVFRHLALITHFHLAAQIHTGNFFELWMEGEKLADRYLEEKCTNFARKNWRRIMETADWDKFRAEDIELCEFIISVINQEALRQSLD